MEFEAWKRNPEPSLINNKLDDPVLLHLRRFFLDNGKVTGLDLPYVFKNTCEK